VVVMMAVAMCIVFGGESVGGAIRHSMRPTPFAGLQCIPSRSMLADASLA